MKCMLDLLLALTSPALPEAIEVAQATRFALACIGTKTSYGINFEYRWGNGSWQASRTNPGVWQQLMWNYDYFGQNRSPALSVRFDSDPTSRINMNVLRLNPAAASQRNCQTDGRTYNFYESGGRIVLLEDN